MRRIVVIAASMAGVRAATRIKRRLFKHEVNVIVPASIAGERPEAVDAGPVQKRYRAGLPNFETLEQRDVGVLEAHDIMPDFAEKEITLSSNRGKLTVRYTDLVLEIAASVRLPRRLQGVEGVFGWPTAGFAAEPEAYDKAFAQAASSGSSVCVVGGGIHALDAVLLAHEAGARVHWLKTGERENAGLDSVLLALVQKTLGEGLTLTDLPALTPDKLEYTLDAQGARLETLTLPDGTSIAPSCCLWTSPLMGRHPVLREEGVTLDGFGRVDAGPESGSGLVIMGSAAAVPAVEFIGSGLAVQPFPMEENAEISGLLALEAVCGKAGQMPRTKLGARAAAVAHGSGCSFFRAGFSAQEAAATGRETEYVAVSLLSEDAATVPVFVPDASESEGALALSLVCDRVGREVIGIQVMGSGTYAGYAEGLFRLTEGVLGKPEAFAELALMPTFGPASRLAAEAAAMLGNKLDGAIKGISPDEYLASREAGAAFFTLDLRALTEWKSGHVPDAYNIPLPQLKKRLQNEVPHFTPIVIVSHDGKDAYAVACRLASLGAADLYVLDGGMRLWPYALEKG